MKIGLGSARIFTRRSLSESGLGSARIFTRRSLSESGLGSARIFTRRSLSESGLGSAIAVFYGPSIPLIKPGWTRLIYCKSVELMLF